MKKLLVFSLVIIGCGKTSVRSDLYGKWKAPNDHILIFIKTTNDGDVREKDDNNNYVGIGKFLIKDDIIEINNDGTFQGVYSWKIVENKLNLTKSKGLLTTLEPYDGDKE